MFQTRIDQEIKGIIDKYVEYININIKGYKINPADAYRAIVKKGIETMINQEGGLQYIENVINKNLTDDMEEGLITPMIDITDFESLSNAEQERIIKAELEAAEKYNKKYFKGSEINE